jgi:hypothetical protein
MSRFRRIGRRQAAIKTAAVGGPRHVQGELSLNAIKVIRNDLSDSDFDVIASAKQSTISPTAAANGPRPGLGMVWNRLSARLLRQAALDFSAVQKERGKLLSQAGHGGGGDRGA